MQLKMIAKQKFLWYNIKVEYLDIIKNKWKYIILMNLKEKEVRNENLKKRKITLKRIKNQAKRNNTNSTSSNNNCITNFSWNST